MKNYKIWSEKERRQSLIKTKAAIATGAIPKAEELGCEWCGQKEGIIDYHNENYSHPTKYLKALCWRCHMIHHSMYRNPEAFKKYFQRVAEGEQDPPVYKRDFNILREDYGIY